MEREQITVRLPIKLLDELKKEASEKGYSFNSYLLFLIEKGRDIKN